MFEYLRIFKQTLGITKSIWNVYSTLGVNNIRTEVSQLKDHHRVSIMSELPFGTRVTTHIDLSKEYIVVDEKLMKELESILK